jgi:hypothetical protein
MASVGVPQGYMPAVFGVVNAAATAQCYRYAPRKVLLVVGGSNTALAGVALAAQQIDTFGGAVVLANASVGAAVQFLLHMSREMPKGVGAKMPPLLAVSGAWVGASLIIAIDQARVAVHRRHGG